MASRIVQKEEINIVSNSDFEPKKMDSVPLGEVEFCPSKKIALAILQDSSIVFEWMNLPKTPPFVVQWEDFINCCAVRNEKKKEEILHIQILSYPVFGVTKKRKGKKRKKSLLQFSTTEKLNDEELQTNWVDRINLIARRFMLSKYKSSRVISESELLEKKRVLVLVNPISGTRSALKNFRQIVAPLLTQAKIEFEVFVTARAQHAYERLRTEDLSKWDALLFMSGDGLVSEGFNGLLSREDASTAIQIPFGVIPCGSGNTMIGSILYYSREDYSVLNAAFVFAKGLYGPTQRTDMGVCKQSDATFYFILCYNIDLINDVGIQSEFLRRIGDTRYLIWAIWRILNRTTYHADIEYLPYDDATPSADINESQWVKLEAPFTVVCVTLIPMVSREYFVDPMHKFNSGYFSLVILPYENVSRLDMLKLLGQGKNDDMSVFTKFIFTKIKAFRITPIRPRNGIQAADGELLVYDTCHAEVSPYTMSFTALIEKDHP